jgi:hypothetical protein
MSRVFLGALFAAALGVGVAAQQAPAPAEKPAEKKDQAPPKTLTLTGCVERGSTPKQFTLEDAQNGRYEVSGSDINKYVGQRVQVAGVPGSTRFKVKGGLYPTPNVAAQAGDIDPARAAVAAQPGGPSSGTGDVSLPTLKVKSVRTLDNACK